VTEAGSGPLSPRERVNRSRARSWALQVLYRWESEGIEGNERDLLDVLQDVARGRRIAPERLPFVRGLLRVIQDHRAELDQALTAATHNWRMDRLSRIDRSILRIGAAELLHPGDVPPRVAIQEAVRLAERYGGDESPRFVNGVLDAVFRRAS
jgi:transcription antitermination protein NusB